MYTAPQFSIFMVNKPGVLAHVLSELARAKLNITAMTVSDSAEHGVMRVVFSAADKARQMMSRLNMPYSETDVLCVILTNKPGALAIVAEKLGRAHINIAYAYCTAGGKGGRTTGVLKVADVKKAMKILSQHERKVIKSQPLVRRPKSAPI